MREIHEHLSKQDRECLRHGEECHDSCLHMIQHCLEKGGRHAQPEHIRLLQDCSQICNAVADFILRGSPLIGAVCAACAQVSAACAKSSADLGDSDAGIFCGRCASSCRLMATHRQLVV